MHKATKSNINTKMQHKATLKIGGYYEGSTFWSRKDR